jgi:PAT family acetyl-CoA transporter-like MFS transporter 1
MGLSGSVPVLMKERGSSYSSLSLFSMVSIPFSVKLLWAPIVDSVYIKKIGRRKTWLVIDIFRCFLLCDFRYLDSSSNTLWLSNACRWSIHRQLVGPQR